MKLIFENFSFNSFIILRFMLQENATSELLRSLGLYRFGELFIKIHFAWLPIEAAFILFFLPQTSFHFASLQSCAKTDESTIIRLVTSVESTHYTRGNRH